MTQPMVHTLVEVPEAVLPRWQRVMNDPLAPVRERVLTSGAVPQDRVDEAIMEYRKFLGLVVMGNGGLAMTSPVVDEVWHTHILFTREYEDFCQDVFGGFLHHKPNTSLTPLTPGGGEKFRSVYRALYGSLPSIWVSDEVLGQCMTKPPMCDSGGCSAACQCEECNCEEA